MERIEKVAVIGAGIMGSGIANTVFKHGIRATLFDVCKEALATACEGIRRKARRGMDPANIVMGESLEDAVRDADLVIEAVFEDMHVKRPLFAELDELAPHDAVFASNTSSLSISDLAEASGRKTRFLGLHFFNPAVIMRLVEVIVTDGLDPDVLETVMVFLEDLKKTGVQCRDSPGFAVNRILVPMVNEAFNVLDERSRGREDVVIAVANDIDSAVMAEMKLLMGPFNLLDLTGIDTICSAAEVIYEGLDRNPRYALSPLLESYRDKGHLGRKTGRGVYYYENQLNDPDLNPPLDKQGRRIVRRENPAFDSTELLAVVVNECCRALEEGLVRAPQDIELCMELGTRWPRGPFRLAGETGLDRIRTVLRERLERTGGNPRYEPCRLLLAPDGALLECISRKEG